MTRAFIFAACLLVVGCTHDVTMMGRQSGAVGSAKITTFGDRSGEIAIDLKGEVYRGKWIFAEEGGMVVGSSVGYVGTTPVYGTSTGVVTGLGGQGSVIAVAPSGARLNCRFAFSQWSNTGMGECMDSAGEVYDLQID